MKREFVIKSETKKKKRFLLQLDTMNKFTIPIEYSKLVELLKYHTEKNSLNSVIGKY